jgi:hypothetical protein
MQLIVLYRYSLSSSNSVTYESGRPPTNTLSLITQFEFKIGPLIDWLSESEGRGGTVNLVIFFFFNRRGFKLVVGCC